MVRGYGVSKRMQTNAERFSGDVATGVWDVANTCGFGLDQGVEYLAGAFISLPPS